TEPWRSIITNPRVGSPKGGDVFSLFLVNLGIRRGGGLPEYFLSDCEVSPLLSGKVGCNQVWTCTAKVVDAVREILADINLAVRVGDFVDHFHSLRKEGARPLFFIALRSAKDFIWRD